MTLRIALQKQGKLAEASAAMLRNCGIAFSPGLGKLKAEAENFPLEILFLRDDDIPDYVADGVADIGIVGQNVLAEEAKAVDIAEKLGFGRCRLSLAVPKAFNYSSVADLAGRRIATSYPKLLYRFLEEKSVTAEIHQINGSVEIAPSIGLAAAVCDLVSSGSTLFSNGLREVETVMQSEAVLIANRDLGGDVLRDVDRLIFRIRSVNAAANNKYILLNAPRESASKIADILPGMRSPTIVPLADPEWVSLQSVVSEYDFWNVVDELRQAGAEGILVVSIDKMIV